MLFCLGKCRGISSYINYDFHLFIQMGDFNNLDISRLISNHRLKQVVSKPTRGGAILVLIITNIHKFYEAPVITAPLRSSDHSTVIWSPCSTNSNCSNKCIKRSARRFSQSGINGYGLWVSLNNWFSELGPNPFVDDLTESYKPQVIMMRLTTSCP